MKRHVVCHSEELPPGEMRSFSLGRRTLVIVRTLEGEYYAIGGTCPHQGAALSMGQVEKMWISDEVGQARSSEDRIVVVCPWHNFEFDLKTGRNPCDPERLRVQTYRIEEDEGEIVVYA